MKVGSLCSGYGGLDLAIESIWPEAEVSWFSEFAPAPAEVFTAHWPGVPNLGDLTETNWSDVEPVDVLTAGYPCQPFSHAGMRKGEEDERHLWPFIAEAIGVLRPRSVVLENVAGHLSLGGVAVVGDLASLGYDARWLVVRASDVGACHRRARWFCVARNSESWRGGACFISGDRGGRNAISAGGSGRDVADADGARLEGSNRRHVGDSEPCRSRSASDSEGNEQREPIIGVGERPELGRGDPWLDWGAYGSAIRRHELILGRVAPEPINTKGHLSARFVEWMQMLPAGWVTDVLRSRIAALKCLGNGVVPLQAAHALTILTEGAL